MVHAKKRQLLWLNAAFPSHFPNQNQVNKSAKVRLMLR
jgi:hypothetical protein